MLIMCKKCGFSDCILNGKVRGVQRYHCKSCNCNFIIGDKREKCKPEAKALAVLLYGSGNASYGMIAKLFKMSRAGVLYWIRSIAKALPEPIVSDDVTEIQLDEMWHFIQKKIAENGYGEQWMAFPVKPSAGVSAIVLLKPSASSLNDSNT